MTNKPQMMICPNWATCTYRIKITGLSEDERFSPPTYWHCDKHLYNHSCEIHKAYGHYPCPPCIPYVAPQPDPSPEMPLIPTLKECQEFMAGWKDIAEAYQKGFDLYSWLYNILQARREAHDQAKCRDCLAAIHAGVTSSVAHDQQVRKAFAEEIVAHLRAEKEGK